MRKQMSRRLRSNSTAGMGLTIAAAGAILFGAASFGVEPVKVLGATGAVLALLGLPLIVFPLHRDRAEPSDVSRDAGAGAPLDGASD